MNKRNYKGITLIALVITIIVLLILAGITIATLTGDNGLLQKFQTAKKQNEDAKELELIKLAVSAAQVAGKGTLTTTNLKNELEINLNDNDIDNNLKPISDYWNYKEYKIENNGNVEKLLLPKEYQQVEYIESTGTQYIDTGVRTSNSTKVKVVAVNTFGLKSYGAALFGGRTSISSSNYSFATAEGCDFVGNGDSGLSIQKNTNTDKMFIVYDNTTISYICGDYSYYDKKLHVQIHETYDIYLFSMNQGGAPYLNGTYKVYSCEIYTDDVLSRNYVPSYRKFDHKPGMYDLVTNTFYTNQGTGEFLKGNDV